MDWLQNQALAWGLNHLVIPALAPLVFLVIQWLKSASDTLDALPKTAKVALAPILSSLVVTLAAFSGSDLACAATASCTLADVTPAVLTATFGAAGAWLLHYLKNRPVRPKSLAK